MNAKLSDWLKSIKNSKNYQRILSIIVSTAIFISGYALGREDGKKSPEDSDVLAGITQNYKTDDVKYTIKSGDSIEGIAQKFKVSMSSILSANNIEDPNKIYAGNVLIIPNVSQETLDEINKQVSEPSQNDVVNVSLPDGFIRGIDISNANGAVNWDILEYHYNSDKFNFVILRLAENWNAEKEVREFTLDKQFEKNLSECNKRGIPYGVYVFSRASNIDEVNTETASVINYINNSLNKTKIVNDEELDLSFNLSLPLYMDCFEKDATNQRAIFDRKDYNKCEEIIRTWCSAIEEAGYFTGVYCSGEFYNTMGSERLKDYSLWIAHYGSKAKAGDIGSIGLNYKVTFDSNIKNQQVSDRGTLEGLSHALDVNILDSDLLKIVEEYYSRTNRKTYH